MNYEKISNLSLASGHLAQAKDFGKPIDEACALVIEFNNLDWFCAGLIKEYAKMLYAPDNTLSSRELWQEFIILMIDEIYEYFNVDKH